MDNQDGQDWDGGLRSHADASSYWQSKLLGEKTSTGSSTGVHEVAEVR